MFLYCSHTAQCNLSTSFLTGPSKQNMILCFWRH